MPSIQVGTDPYVLVGRVVTMVDPPPPDAPNGVLDRGGVYIRGNSIEAVLPDPLPAGVAVPAGFENAERIDTQGTLYPGLIELHNHLSYDVLRLWNVPQQYVNRDKWSKGDVYRGSITGPMKILGSTPGLGEAVVRWVEAKCLLAGTTTSQGIALAGDAGIQPLYFGTIRNVEETKDPALHDAATRIADVVATDVGKFEKRLQGSTCLLLHLAEGQRSDPDAHEHFEALHVAGDDWAISDRLAGIHCVALQPADFTTMADRKGSMVWSPMSNLLLYGETADVASAKAAGVRIGIGSDWSPSGSKNLLFELRAARVVADVLAPGVFSDRDLIAMATTTAADILGWKKIGRLAADQRADVLVVSGKSHEAHQHLFTRSETDVQLVVIDGIPRVGTTSLMGRFAFGGATESVAVGSTTRLLFLEQSGVLQAIADLKLSEARHRLTTALHDLPELAKDLENPIAPAFAKPAVNLFLDHDDVPGVSLRPELPGPDGEPTGRLTPEIAAVAAKPLSQLVQPLVLDPLTVADDGEFIVTMATERNLPKAIAEGIRAL
jgi:cytosine/adenosine deaminase-related metal-dependent hydrolase